MLVYAVPAVFSAMYIVLGDDNLLLNGWIEVWLVLCIEYFVSTFSPVILLMGISRTYEIRESSSLLWIIYAFHAFFF